jgi:ketosteroid isomerase-like protein
VSVGPVEEVAMASEAPPILRSADLFRLLDAGDGPGMLAMSADDVQKADEMTTGWLRGRAAFAAHLAEGLPALSDCRSRLDDAHVERWGDVEVETFMLHQSYVYSGTQFEIQAPTTVIWRREADAWRVVLINSVGIPVA